MGNDGSRPCDSDPSTRATARFPAASTPASWRAPSRGSAATTAAPSARSASRTASASVACTTGTRSTEPAEARTALGAQGSAPPTTTTQRAAQASAVRMMVPVLPGSETPTSTSTRSWRARDCGSSTSGRPTTASTGWGLTAGVTDSKARSVRVSTSIPALRRSRESRTAGACTADSATNTAESWIPASRASDRLRGPSRNTVESLGARRRTRRRSSATRLWRGPSAWGSVSWPEPGPGPPRPRWLSRPARRTRRGR